MAQDRMHQSLHVRLPLPAKVIAVAVRPRECECLVEIVGIRNVVQVQNLRDAELHLPLQAESCVVLAVSGDSDESQLSNLLRIRTHFPFTPILALFYPLCSSCKILLRFGAIGISEVLDTSAGADIHSLRQALSRCRGAEIAVKLWRISDLRLPDAAVSLFKAALRVASAPVTTQKLANATGMHERSLRKYCAKEALPSPQFIIGWARMLMAAFYLDEPGRSVGQTSDLLGFPDASALRTQFRRYTQRTYRSLRANGVLRSVARALEAAVAAERRKRGL